MKERLSMGIRVFLTLLALLVVCGPFVNGQEKAKNDLGPAQSIQINAQGKSTVTTLSGRDSGLQLLVTAKYANGSERDLSRSTKYEAAPPDIVNVAATGYVTSLRDGKATITATIGNSKQAIDINVTNVAVDVPLNFANDIVPIFTRFGCNSGGCHGKSGGQNGFQLSLLGFEPQEDYEFLVKESRGRRLSVGVPEMSLLLTKSSGRMPHGGGIKLRPESPHYRMLHRWIEQAAPYGDPKDVQVTRIEVFPRDRTLTQKSEQQLQVIAHYTDGTTRDVTRLTQFESNHAETASVSEMGLVTTYDLTGTAAIMTRYLTHVDVFRATIPLGAVVANLPAAKNFIDEAVFKQWQKLGLPPSEICDDSTFLRRVTLDLAGRLPTLDETAGFLADKGADRREKLVDRLLVSPDYADLFANKWNAVLRNKRESLREDIKPTLAFHGWIRNSLRDNKPFDVFVREIITATGEEIATPPVAWYRAVRDVPSQVEDVCQLFLGTRLQCARCHHHPLEKWSQQDYYGMAAFFSRVQYKKPAPLPKGAKQPKGAAKPLTHILHDPGLAKAENPRTKEYIKPTALNGKTLDVRADVDPRIQLADWITSKENPMFARALVNRYWKHFLGRGLTEPEDDIRLTNPPTNPELLDGLANYFVAEKFDIKKLVRAICLSTTYQLSSKPNEWNRTDKQSFSRFTPRRLPAEIMFDAIDALTLAKSDFPGMPAGTRAIQLPDHAFESYFLTVFGRPDATSACECERSSDVSLSQMLHLMNSYEMIAKVSGEAPKGPLAKVTNPKGKNPPAVTKTKVTPGQRLAKIISDKRSDEEKLRELYLIAYSREPNARELELLTSHLKRQAANPRAAYEDILWVIVNSEEFLFNQ